MKHYICKYCGFSGTRVDVRLHLREKHGIRGLLKGQDGKRLDSQLTKSTKTIEIDTNINERGQQNLKW